MHGEMTGLEIVSVGLALLSAILGWTLIRQRREAAYAAEVPERPDVQGPDRVLLTTLVSSVSEPVLMHGERIEAAFWYSDLRGFTALSESLPAPQLLQLLHRVPQEVAAERPQPNKQNLTLC
jgi:class 3 adenylate cyclase